MEESENEKLRRLNCKAEPIYRSHTDTFASNRPLEHIPRSPYPWESDIKLPRITKEFFRCKGSPIADSSDCEGSSRHGLPIIHGKENVYPILLDLLNYVQKKTGKRVIVTCGHRCPIHNTYADPSKENQLSKHQIGAEVDFYVQGMEERPQEIAGILMQYFQDNPAYKKDKESQEFKRLESSDVAIQPWYNKEILIKLFQKQEGRDIDNHHPHPYLSIQVRYDREGKEKVAYNWAKAHQGYPRS